MEIQSTSGMQQHMQMRKMDGTGGGHGKHGTQGMKDIMASLSEDDKTALKEKMQSLSQEDRKEVMGSLKEVDTSNSNYTQALFDIIDNTTNNNILSTDTPVYA